MCAGLWQLLVAVSAFLAMAAAQETGAAPMVPALFVFGDSLLDSGNNNNLASLAKANYLPYGIDFAAGPTGRFCNGYTIVDELGTYACTHVRCVGAKRIASFLLLHDAVELGGCQRESSEPSTLLEFQSSSFRHVHFVGCLSLFPVRS